MLVIEQQHGFCVDRRVLLSSLHMFSILLLSLLWKSSLARVSVLIDNPSEPQLLLESQITQNMPSPAPIPDLAYSLAANTTSNSTANTTLTSLPADLHARLVIALSHALGVSHTVCFSVVGLLVTDGFSQSPLSHLNSSLSCVLISSGATASNAHLFSLSAHFNACLCLSVLGVRCDSSLQLES